MCRFALYLGDPARLSALVTEPVNSIIHQSFHSHEREEPLNGDGFGVGWYAPELREDPAIFKDISPAWSNMNLLNLAPVTRSRCILAHVRAATPGLPVTLLNCHPFSWGRFAFMHNGHLGGYRTIYRRLRGMLSDDAYGRIQGSTDSEHVFALFSDRYLGATETDGLERMITALVGAVRETERIKEELEVTDPSLLNLALTDGERAVVTRYVSGGEGRANSLYVRTGGRFICREGVPRMGPAPAGGGGGGVVIASEPLTAEPGWDAVPLNHMVAVDADGGVELRPIEL